MFYDKVWKHWNVCQRNISFIIFQCYGEKTLGKKEYGEFNFDKIVIPQNLLGDFTLAGISCSEIL